MTKATPRRTEAVMLRQTISQLLDQIFAIEQSLQIFQRKGDRAEIEHAAENFHDMLGHVDRLGDMIADARRNQRAAPDLVPERVA